MLDAQVFKFEFRIVMLQGLLEPSEDEDLLMIPAMLVEALCLGVRSKLGVTCPGNR